MIDNVISQQRHLEKAIFFFIFLTFILSSNSFIYSNENAHNEFKAFKDKFNKTYKSVNEEEDRYRNFIKNLNELTNLNEVSKDNTTIFILNQYADLDPHNIDEHYAIRINPYEKISNNTDAKVAGRMKIDEIDFSKMYDLYKADDLYKEYMRKHHRNVSRQFDRIVHYYRFIKTLIEINRSMFEETDSEPKELGDNADIVNEPNEYFY